MIGRFAWASLEGHMEGGGTKDPRNEHVFKEYGKDGWLAHSRLASYVHTRWNKHADLKKKWAQEARDKVAAAGAGGAP